MPGPDLRLLAAEQQDLLSEGATAVDAVRAAAVFVVVAVVVRRALVRYVDRDGSRHMGRLLGRFLSLLVAALGAVYALDLLGVRIGPLLGTLGVGGIALAFAAQDILQNLVAGVLLQVRRPFRIVDQIGSGDDEGVVEDIDLRTVELTTYDGLTVHLPNAEVLEQAIVNDTRTPHSRTELAVGVGYDTGLEQARGVLMSAYRAAPGVQGTPAPEAWVHAFGESSIDIAVRYWHAADIASRWGVRSAVAVCVKRELDAAGMHIPFLQRTLWFGPGERVLDVRTADRPS